MVEGARLESVYRGNSIEGSNPSLSAIMQTISRERWLDSGSGCGGHSCWDAVIAEYRINRDQSRVTETGA